ncbi:MAG: hypothetical protein NDJ92_00570 [Thermoanaerobaculia bacterium]|nr:hypothetical protein [Thermoanaerobaculia bacterium]
MPIPRYGVRWRIIALVLTIGLVASYVWYQGREPFTHGGTPTGLIYGFVALFMMGFLLYFGIRKRAYRSRFGTLQEWLHAHIWLGLFSFFVIVAHTGLRFQDKIAVALFVVIVGVIATGIFGALLYKTIPRELTEIQSNLTGQEISDQLNQLSKAMARIASGKSSPFQRIYYSLQREAMPGFLAGWKLILSSGKRNEKAGDWTGLVGMVEKSEQDELRQLLVASRQQKELHLRLVYQQRYRNILDFWLYLHIPLSVAMIVLIFAHVWGVFYYGVVKF